MFILCLKSEVFPIFAVQTKNEKMSVHSISPIDGRYSSKTQELRQYFSEAALIRYRVQVEVEYFIALCQLPLPQLASFNKGEFVTLRRIYQNLSQEQIQHIKEIEQTTNHDVKAVEYFLKEQFDALQIAPYKEFIHFGLTSQDVNNTAMPLLLKEAMQQAYFPALERLTKQLEGFSQEWESVPMLARTHGQPASPTRLGKELAVFIERIRQQQAQFAHIPFPAKFAGATGNFNAHQVAYPNIDWRAFAQQFVEEQLGLHYSFPTTQIEHYDHLAALFDACRRINIILIDLCRDIWAYISQDYFKQRIKQGEVGSSAMPHKVNPIDFENAEGNLAIANALFDFLSNKLPISRLQRDLTDSTVMRNIGVPFAHTLIALKAICHGMSKLLLHQEKINSDLQQNWAVVAEGIQTILRREGYPNPYEALKSLTRTNQGITQQALQEFIGGLSVPASVKEELLAITPFTYTGI